MTGRRFVVVAGIPPELGDLFERELGKGLEGWTVLARQDLAPHAPYTPQYASSLFERTASRLRRRVSDRGREDLLAGVHLVLLYVARDGSESALVEAFELEALTVPLTWEGTLQADRATGNDRRRATRILVSEAIEAVRGAKRLLAVIAEEVFNRDNKTCLLLPPKNLGSPSEAVIRCVQEAASEGRDPDGFRMRIEAVARSLRTDRQGSHTYFVGKQGLVFRAPSKAGARHGYAPTWGESDHRVRCVLRGRLRFGVPFDPSFHYDCDVNRREFKVLPSCHEAVSPSGRRHVNIAPNDNVR